MSLTEQAGRLGIAVSTVSGAPQRGAHFAERKKQFTPPCGVCQKVTLTGTPRIGRNLHLPLASVHCKIRYTAILNVKK